ncbi:DUF1793-domain-containing protein [Schizopora paradoxa]|uniref:DUF1793-domain-containing protein n=1 Tax=Schizopora paradoxa TaxID=27342 RepID=A0A0H2RE18_9AGAM|nr:DUF1793-domain-containing protein [Schizopora paradoxa]
MAPAWPLAVKNPFVNAWFRAGPEPSAMNIDYPKIWNLLDSSATDSNLGLFCGVLVDGQSYRLLGQGPGKASTQVSIQITPTQTTVLHQAGPLEITLNFLSPITATDLTKQSLPFAYVTLTASSMDGATHSLQVYYDISAEWAIGDNSLFADTTVQPAQDDFVILQVLQQTVVPFAVINDRAQDSSAILATANGVGVLFGVGSDVQKRGMNATTPALANTVESEEVSSHAIGNPWDFWGVTIDLGNITDMTTPLVSAVGAIRDPSIQLIQLSGNVENQSPYYQMNFSTPLDIVSFFLNDFNNSMDIAKQLDNQIINDSANISQSYADLLSLVARQAMSAIEITVSRNPDGNFNSSDTMAFMMDMGSVGAGYVNAVDVLYAAFPMYLYLNPDLGGHLLRPLLVAQDNPQYSQPYAARGLGTNFPNATTVDVTHNLGIEESGNMIIMLLAHLQATGDGSLVKQHYSLIRRWADYLVQFSMNPGFQQTSPSDGISAVNQTNLALKGIIGLGAMAKISSFMGMDNDASVYNNTAKSSIDLWQNFSISENKTYLTTSASGSSAGLIYNLYADKLLQLDLVPQPMQVYDLQTSYYKSQIGFSKVGIPNDSQNPTIARADWMMFAAAASGDNDLMNSIISMVHSYAFTPSANVPITPIFDPTSGTSSGEGINSPSMGAMFSILALNKPLKLKVDGMSAANTTSHSDVRNTSEPGYGVIIAGVLGGVASLGLVYLGVVFYRKRLRNRRRISARPYSMVDALPPQYSDAPNNLAHRPQLKLRANEQQEEPAEIDPPSYTSEQYQ